MSEKIVKFYRGSEAQVVVRPPDDGFLVATDAAKLFVDADGTRLPLSDIVFIDNADALPLAPLDKFYITRDKGEVYIFRESEWKTVGANAPATIALPVPCDEDNENLTLVVDFSTTGEFVETGGMKYTRVRMSDKYAKMRIFSNGEWIPVPGPSVGVPYYASTVEFTLDDELFPGYVPGKKYYARYCWIDSNGNPGDWVGFAFSGDVADLVPIHTNDKVPLKVCAEVEKSGSIRLDYLDGEVQNIKLTANAGIDLERVFNVTFGEALIVNVAANGHTLTVSNSGNSYSCTDNKVYVVVITNFGSLNIAVTETI